MLDLWRCLAVVILCGSTTAALAQKPVDAPFPPLIVDGANATLAGDEHRFEEIQVGVTRADSTLSVSDAAVLVSDGTVIGGEPQAVGAIHVRGLGTHWRSRNSFYVGGSGSGALRIEHAGYLNSDRASIGRHTEGDGTVTVSGSGSEWRIRKDRLYVGNDGNGTLLIENGGHISCARDGYISRNRGAIGEAIVTGSGSRWSIRATLGVGLLGHGSLEIKDGGSVTNAAAMIGRYAGGSGIVVVAGRNSTWFNRQYLLIGGGAGILRIENGAGVSCEEAILAKSVRSSSGTVHVSGDGSHWQIRGGLSVGGDIAAPGGSADVRIADGGTVSVDGSALVWQRGVVQVGQEGTLDIPNGPLANEGKIHIARGGTISAGGIDNSGTIHSRGTIQGDIATREGGVLTGREFGDAVTISDGGTFSPGDGPATATTAITGWGQGGRYLVEMRATGDSAGTDTGWDLWHTNSLTIHGPFEFKLRTMATGDDPDGATKWDPATNHQWLIATATNGALKSVDQLEIDATAFKLPLEGGRLFLTAADDGNQLFLNFLSAKSGVSAMLAGSSPSQLTTVVIGLSLAVAVVILVTRLRKVETVSSADT